MCILKRVVKNIMITKTPIILLFLLASCTSSYDDKSNEINKLILNDLSYTHLDGMSGDTFNFTVKSNQDINVLYQDKNYKFSHIRCENFNHYSAFGSISIDDGEVKNHNEYIYSGYLKICTNDSMNDCLEKRKVIEILPENLKCKITFEGLFLKSTVISDNIILFKDQFLKADKKL